MKERDKAISYFELVKYCVDHNNEEAPYKCKLCGSGDIPHEFEICGTCGWQDDVVQNMDHDYEGGANYISYNQYKLIWETNKERIMSQVTGKGRLVREIYKQLK